MWNLRKLVCGEIRSIIEINKIVRDPKRGLLHSFAEAFFFKLYNDKQTPYFFNQKYATEKSVTYFDLIF